MHTGLLFLLALGVVVLSFIGIGIGILIGRRKSFKDCACEFDDEARRRQAAASRGSQGAPKSCDQPCASCTCEDRPSRH